MSKYTEICLCLDMPKAKRKNWGLVAACSKCHQLFVCHYTRYIPDSGRAGGYFHWKLLKGKK